MANGGARYRRGVWCAEGPYDAAADAEPRHEQGRRPLKAQQQQTRSALVTDVQQRNPASSTWTTVPVQGPTPSSSEISDRYCKLVGLTR
jgi:hypothetical protein